MKPLPECRAVHLLHALAKAVIHHRRWFCGVQLFVVLVCLGFTVTTLQFSTSRNDLISGQESYRRQFLEFRKEFKIQDNLFVLVESESREKNREFVERLATRLRVDGRFAGVYYRAGLKLLGPKALLFLPEESLVELHRNVRTNQALFQTYSRATNLNGLFTLVNRQFRLLDTRSPGKLKEGALTQSLESLQRVVNEASESIESQETPLTPNISTLLDSRQPAPVQDLYLTFDRGQVYVLITQPQDSRQERAAIMQLRKWIARTQSEVPGVNAEITGEAVLNQGEMEQARHDTEVAALLAFVLTASIFIGSCRDVLRPLMASVCLLTGISYSLGFATLAVGRFNILSITLVPILIGLAIDYGVHLIFRYEEEVDHGHSRQLAIGKALGFTGLGVIGNAMSIAGAFYCMLLTDFKGMHEMGLIAGSGVILCLVPMLTLLPLLLIAAKTRPSGPPSKPSQSGQRDPLLVSLPFSRHKQPSSRGQAGRLARIGQCHLRYPWFALGVGTVFTIFMFLQAFRLQFDYNLLNLQSRGLPAVRMQKKLLRADAQSLLYCAVVANSLGQAVEWEQRIRQLPSVARVISLVKYLTEDQARKLALINEIKEMLGAVSLPEPDAQPINLTDLNRTLFSLSGYLGRAVATLQSSEGQDPTEERLRSVHHSVDRLRGLTQGDLESTRSRLTTFQQGFFGSLFETIRLVEQQDNRQRLQPDDVPGYLRDFFISRSGKFLLQVYPNEDVWQRDKQETFIRELRTVDPDVTGSPVQFYEYTSRLRMNVEKAAAYAAGIIGLLVFLHFRRLSSVLLALLPMVLGFCWMLGLMGWLGISLNPVNIVSLILVIGIGITNGIHILHRFAEEPHPNVLATSTGKAVLVSGLNTMAGFGSLLVAQHQGIASLGGVMALGTGTCLVAALTFLPAVLALLSRVGWSPTALPLNCEQSSAISDQ